MPRQLRPQRCGRIRLRPIPRRAPSPNSTEEIAVTVGIAVIVGIVGIVGIAVTVGIGAIVEQEGTGAIAAVAAVAVAKSTAARWDKANLVGAGRSRPMTP